MTKYLVQRCARGAPCFLYRALRHHIFTVLTGLARCNGDKFTTEYSVRSIGLAFPRHWLFLAEAQLGLARGWLSVYRHGVRRRTAHLAL